MAASNNPALGVGEHGVDDAMLSGIELARTKIAVHTDTHVLGRAFVERWPPVVGWVRFYRVSARRHAPKTGKKALRRRCKSRP
jgi:hypothetical protein